MNREEIIAAVKEETGISIDEVTTICQNNIDRVQDRIASGLYYDNGIAKFHDFSFLIGYSEINTQASYSTGTVDVVNGSTTVAGTGTTWTSNHIGWIFKTGTECYKVDTVVSETEITLSNAYIGDSDTGLSYELIKVFYSLPSDLKSIRWVKQLITPSRLTPISELSMAEFVPDELSHSGEITNYILSGIDDNGIKLIRFFPCPTSQKRIYICYDRQLPSINTTGAESEIPSRWHTLFVYGLSEVVWRRLDRPDKIDEVKNAFNEMMFQAVIEDKKITRDNIEQMADEAIYKRRINYPRLPSNYPIE